MGNEKIVGNNLKLEAGGGGKGLRDQPNPSTVR